MRKLLTGILLLGLSAAVFAQTTVPTRFISGTPAKAAEVNANFQALATAIDNLALRINRLEGVVSAADLAGTYALAGLHVSTAAYATSFETSHDNTNGTVVLNPDKTFTLSVTNSGSTTRTAFNLAAPTPGGDRAVTNLGTTISPSPKTESGAGTWDLSGDKLILTFPGPNPDLLTFTMSAGASMFVSSNDEGSIHRLALLIRLQRAP